VKNNSGSLFFLAPFWVITGFCTEASPTKIFAERFNQWDVFTLFSHK
jgi:hypothetical protein